MGRGIWLNPKTGVWLDVSVHAATLKDAASARRLSLPEDVIEQIQHLSPFYKPQHDRIRMLGIESGLVRFRDQGRELVIQYKAPPKDEREVLKAVYNTIVQIPDYASAWQLRIDNFATRETHRMTVDELCVRCESDESES